MFPRLKYKYLLPAAALLCSCAAFLPAVLQAGQAARFSVPIEKIPLFSSAGRWLPVDFPVLL